MFATLIICGISSARWMQRFISQYPYIVSLSACLISEQALLASEIDQRLQFTFRLLAHLGEQASVFGQISQVNSLLECCFQSRAAQRDC